MLRRWALLLVAALSCLPAAAQAPVLFPSAFDFQDPAAPLLVHSSQRKLPAITLPLSFEENRGQADPAAKFLSRGPGYSALFAPDGIVLHLNRAGSEPATLRLLLSGGNTNPEISGEQPLPGKSNYFIGNDPTRWHTNIATFARVRYRNVYPGIDLVFYGHDGLLEHDFIVAPGADPSQIRVHLEGAHSLRRAANGDVVVALPGGEVRLRAPRIYQEIGGERRELSGGYRLTGRNELAFRVAGRDRRRAVVIDPGLSYSTYFGGYLDDYAYAVAVDSAGYVYLAGYTQYTYYMPYFPTKNSLQSFNGSYDAFITKIDITTNSLVYSTLLGGSTANYAQGIALDPSGNVYVAGWTQSNDFPVVNAIQNTYGGNSDAFLVKLNSAGSALVYSTYLGGTGNDYGYGLAVDSSGNAYVTGRTESTNFPLANAADGTYGGSGDAFVTKINAAGSAFAYSTYLGGTFTDTANAIAIDSFGNAYVTGLTQSTNFPTKNPLQAAIAGNDDAFVTELSSTGSLIYSTYLGGSDYDEARAIAVDGSGSAYVAGMTASTNFPTANPYQSTYKGTTINSKNCFLTKLNGSGSALTYSTYFGGKILDVCTGIAVDSTGDAYITGYTSSTDHPVANALQGFLAGSYDAFAAKFDPTGQTLLFSTYVGGSKEDDAFALALDSSGNAYLTGMTISSDFPTLNPYQRSIANPNNYDIFLSKIEALGTAAQITSPAGNSQLPGSTVTFNWTSTGAAEYWLWLGTTRGSLNLYDANQGTNTSVVISGLPTVTKPLYARLFSWVNGAWQYNDYRFTQATGVATMTSPTPGSVLPGPSVTFKWTQTGSTSYWLWIGTTAGSSNLYDAGQGTNNSVTINSLPTNGQTLYVRLFTWINGAWQFNDYTYTASGTVPATMISPADGSLLPGSSVTFNWTNTGAPVYWLWIGTTPGGLNIYDASQGTNTSVTVNGLPTKGQTLYVRLFTWINGAWQYNDYSYTEAPIPAATMKTPIPGTTLSGSSVMFTWNDTGASEYWLWVGSSPGTYNYYDANQMLNTSVTVNSLPTDGSTVYVRLFSWINGGWQYHDYSYTAFK